MRHAVCGIAIGPVAIVTMHYVHTHQSFFWEVLLYFWRVLYNRTAWVRALWKAEVMADRMKGGRGRRLECPVAPGGLKLLPERPSQGEDSVHGKPPNSTHQIR